LSHLCAAAFYWLGRRQRTERRFVGVLLTMSLILVALSLIHFADYYLVKHDRIAIIQFIRLSPLITVFGAICLASSSMPGPMSEGARAGRAGSLS